MKPAQRLTENTSTAVKHLKQGEYSQAEWFKPRLDVQFMQCTEQLLVSCLDSQFTLVSISGKEVA